MVQNVLTVNDFNNILDEYFGQQVSHTPVTQTTDNISGEETLTDGTPVTIKCSFIRYNQKWTYEKAGFYEQGDAIMLAKIADTVAKNDKVTWQGVNYRVREKFDVPGIFDSTGSGTTYVYTACNMQVIE